MKKKVLFIGIGFYDYEQSIIEEFNTLGYEVDYYSEVPSGIKYRYYLKKNDRAKLQQIIEESSIKIANSCGTAYNLVFIIKGELLTQAAIDVIKVKSPGSKWILYLWDSLDRIPGSRNIFKNFDKIYSFDRLDCLSNKILIFNPLFYRKEFDKRLYKEREEKYDIYFLGWYHSDRLQLVKKIISFCEQNNIRHKMLLYTGYVNFLLHTILGRELRENRRNLIFKAITAKKNAEFIGESKAVLDIAHPLQSGLTMRTIELLGAQKKIVTTNEDIRNYDFYHPDNVLIIDRNSCNLDKDFFKRAYFPISQNIIEQYSLQSWLKRMLPETNS